MKFKRRTEGKTNYVRRLKMLKSESPRLVVRKTLNYIIAQVVEFGPKGDKTIVSANSKELKKMGWRLSCDNVPAAYLVGLLVGRRAKAKNIANVNLDAGLYTSTKGSRVYSVAKGVVDSGLNMPIDAEMFPSEERIEGKHISFMGDKVAHLSEDLNTVKQKILRWE